MNEVEYHLLRFQNATVTGKHESLISIKYTKERTTKDLIRDKIHKINSTDYGKYMVFDHLGRIT